MRLFIVRVVLVFFFLGAPSVFCAETETSWFQRIDKDAVSVHTRRVEGSPYLEFQARVIINASVEKVVALLEDPEKMPLWYPQCVRASVLKDEGPLQKVCYLLVHFPWPVSERDSVFRMVKREDPQAGTVYYDLFSLPDYIPREKGLVRVAYLSGRWEITPRDDGRTDVLVRQHSDPGGWVPSTFVNKLVVQVPFVSLKNLRFLLEQAEE